MPERREEEPAKAEQYRRLLYTTTEETDPLTQQPRLVRAPTPMRQAYDAGKLAPTDVEKATLQKFHDLLYQTKTEKDIITDEEKTSAVESPLKQVYLEKQQAYEDAALLYNGKRVNVMAGDEKAAVLNFSLNAATHCNKVKSAMNAWTTAGHKNHVEDMEAYIAQVTGRSMATWFAGLRDIYDRASFTEPSIDFTFHPVRLFPANFFNQTWMNFSFHENEVTTHSDTSSTSWNMGGGAGFAFWSAKASAGGSSARQNASVASVHFSMSFDFAQVKILRPWFGTELFSCRGWKLDPGTWTFGNPQLSTGGNKPAGSFIAYSTNMLFVKNLKIEFDKAAWQNSAAQWMMNFDKTFNFVATVDDVITSTPDDLDQVYYDTLKHCEPAAAPPRRKPATPPPWPTCSKPWPAKIASPCWCSTTTSATKTLTPRPLTSTKTVRLPPIRRRAKGPTR